MTNICIVANKDLRLNTRVARQTETLVEGGYDVTVVALAAPQIQHLHGPGRWRFLDASWASETFFIRHAASWAKRISTVRTSSREQASEAAQRPVSGWHAKAMCGALGRAGWTPFNRFAFRAARRVIGRRFDVVQAHDDGALLAAAEIRRRCGGRLLFDAVELPHEPEYQPKVGLRRCMRERERVKEVRVIRGANGMLTVSDSLADLIARNWGMPRPVVVRNCRRRTEIFENKDIRRDIRLSPAERLVLYLNSMWPGQGLEQLVVAMRDLPEHVHVATLGPESKPGYAAQLRALANRHDVNRRLHILPVLPPNRLLAYASGADIGIIPRQNAHPNLYYSLPNRVFEMIAAHLPIAACRLPEIAGIVEKYRIGQVFDETSPQSIAEVLTEMLEPERLRNLRAAAAAASKSLTWENEATAYLAAIEKLGTPLPSEATEADALGLRQSFGAMTL